MVSREQIVELVQGAIKDPREAEVQGADVEDLDELERRLGHPLPPPLRQWLCICCGAAIGPGGFFGNHPDKPHLDIPSVRSLFPEWRARGWLPVAGDGFGNYYVLLRSGQVGFVDAVSDPSTVQPDIYPDLFSCVENLLGADRGS